MKYKVWENSLEYKLKLYFRLNKSKFQLSWAALVLYFQYGQEQQEAKRTQRAEADRARRLNQSC